MIAILNWLELVNKNDKSQTIYCINRDCDAPYVEEREIDDCEFVIDASPNADDYSINDIFSNTFWAKDCFLTKEEAEEHLARTLKERPTYGDDEEVWIVVEKYEVHKVKAARVRWYANDDVAFKTKEKADERAEELNKLAMAILKHQKGEENATSGKS